MSGHVLVAGAGPVGLTAALVLARRGVAVTVLERGEGLAAESRASTFHPPTLEMLADLGVYEELRARGLVTPTFAYRDRRSGPIAVLDLAVLRDDTPYPFRIQCEQSRLTPILLDRLGGHAEATVRFGMEVTGVEQDGGGVTVRSAGGDVRGDWLIGADGASSAVRRACGIDFAGMTYPERFVVISTDEDLDALLPGLAGVNYVVDPDEWMVLLRTPDHWRVLLPTPDGTDDDTELAAARVQERLRGVADPGRPWSVLHASIYRVHQRVAATFLHGRVLLCGDAAHVNNPLGGMGMNSGIHDAVALAGVLADLTAGRASLADLARVAARRREIALDVVQRTTHANWERIRQRDPAARAAADAELRAMAADPERMRRHLLVTSMIASLGPAAPS